LSVSSAVPTVRAVFFDAVGTLLLPAEPVAQTYRAAASRQGLAIDENTIRVRLRESFERQELMDQGAGWRTDEGRERQRWQSIVRDTLWETADPEACFAELWEWYRSPAAWRLQAGTEQVLNELAGRGLILGMASNFDARLAPIVAAFAELGPLAGNCLISSLVGWRKPSVEFYREVVQRSHCAPDEVLFIGDDPRNDFRGAREAGLRSLLLGAASTTLTSDSIEHLSDVFAFLC
jgi:putative hydrolase of the HAD superfamily